MMEYQPVNMTDAAYRPGRVLRANGRYSLTHQWLLGAFSLQTRCGLTYEIEELWPEWPERFVDEAPGEPDFMRCNGCFKPDGTMFEG